MNEKDIELCFLVRQERLKLQRQVDKLEQEEKDLLYQIQKDMVAARKGEAYFGGYTVSVKSKDAPVPTDWPAILAYIIANNSTDLLQRRLTESAVKARWDRGIDIPGIDKSVKYQVTITKE